MAKKLVIVVGVGALGSHVVQFLRNLDATLRVIDFDRVERKNLASQFHAKASAGKGKVQSLGQTVNFLWGLKLDALNSKVTDKNVAAVLGAPPGGEVSLIIDCLDNAEARKLIQDHARKTRTPCLHGALAPNGMMGRVQWDEDFIIDSEAEAGAATCEDGDHLPFIALTSAYLARSAQEFLTTGRKLGFDVYPLSPSTKI